MHVDSQLQFVDPEVVTIISSETNTANQEACFDVSCNSDGPDITLRIVHVSNPEHYF